MLSLLDTLTFVEPLNPDVYLNHLSPAEAQETEIGRDITLVVLGVSGLGPTSSCIL